VYSRPTVAGGSSVPAVTICKGPEAAATVMESTAICDCPAEATWTTNVAVPVAAGVPEIAPSVESESPPGRLPSRTDHASVPSPPTATSWKAYGTWTSAVGRFCETISSPSAPIAMGCGAVATSLARLSSAVTWSGSTISASV